MPHPYTTTIAGLAATIRQLRSTFPNVVTADTLKKWSIASKNEAPIIGVLKFLKIVDDEGKKMPDSGKAFVEHDDTEFAKKFGVIVKAGYSDLFDTWGEGAWTLEKNKLIGFFRNADGSSARVGHEQASTFLALAGLAGHTAAAAPPTTGGTKPTSQRVKKPAPAKESKKGAASPATEMPVSPPDAGFKPSVTLRVEINLPVTDDQTVYDSIFKSIREQLLNA